jgi:hypothetical protein
MKQIDLSRALEYVDQHGNIQDKGRLLFVLMGEAPPIHITRPLLDKQNIDGGFPSRPRGENPSSVDSTLTALWQLNDVGLLNSTDAHRALSFLANIQQEDGRWDENPDLPLHDLPPWIVPGQEATQIYLTAYASYWLGLTDFSPKKWFLKGLQYLATQQSSNGKIPGYLHSQWIATGAFLLAEGEFRKAADLSIKYMEERPLSEWEDSQISWALDCFGTAGLTADHPFVQSLLSELAERQEPAGSWASEDGPAYAVSATISSLKAFKIFGVITDL